MSDKLLEDLPLGSAVADADLFYSKQGGISVRQPASAFTRRRLSADLTYYVLKTGSDSNTGLANTAGGAFLTIGKAVTAVSTLLDDGSGWTVNIQVGAGTYTENLILDDLVMSSAGTAHIFPASTATIDGHIYVTAGSPFKWEVFGFTHQNTSGNDCFEVDGGFVSIGSSTWGTVSGGSEKSHVAAHNGGIAYQTGTDTISGGAAMHWNSQSGGLVRHRGATITLSGTPAFSTAFAFCDNGGDMQVDNNTFTGSATGKRFVVQAGGRLKTNTQDLTYLPGSTAGTVNGGFFEGIMGCSYPITTAPTTQTGATYTVGASDHTIIANRAGTVTLTLPSAANYSGRWIHVKTITANTVVSASSNVVPLIGGSAGTAILAATAGKWAALQSDGTSWIIMAGA